MTTVDMDTNTKKQTADPTAGATVMTIAALGFVGYAVILFALNFTDGFFELGIGSGQIDVDKQGIAAFSPSLLDYISHLQLAVSAFVAATGVAVAALSWFGVRSGLMWAWNTAVVTPVLALTVALPSHYPNGFDTVGHLGLVYLATIAFVVGAAMARPGVLAAQPQG